MDQSIVCPFYGFLGPLENSFSPEMTGWGKPNSVSVSVSYIEHRTIRRGENQTRFIELGDKIKSDKSLFPLQKPKEGFIAHRGNI